METPTGPVLLLGDMHGDTGAVAYAIDVLARNEGDTLIQLGDFGWWPGNHGGHNEYMRKVDKIAGRQGVRVLFLRGNHENQHSLGYQEDEYPDFAPVQMSDNITFLPDGTRWEWNGKKFLVVGGGISVDRKWRRIGVSYFYEETIHPDVARRIREDGPADVMLTHDCPTGVSLHGSHKEDMDTAGMFPVDAIMDSEIHRQALRQIVNRVQPSELFHGHYHTRRTETLLLHDTGKECVVTGLDMNGTFERSWLLYEPSVGCLPDDSLIGKRGDPPHAV